MEIVVMMLLVLPLVLFLFILFAVLNDEGFFQNTRPFVEKKCQHDYDMEFAPGTLNEYYKCNKCGDVVRTSQEALIKMGLF